MTSLYFTSDTHFGHTNIIKHCNRPFASVEEMDEKLIENWNARVGRGDEVYHIGDFSLAKDGKKIPEYRKCLNGQIHLIYGNHDQKRLKFLVGFQDLKPYKEIKVGDQKIILMHYAFRTWNGAHRGAWNLHGHSHGSLKRDFTMKQFDVGVDVWNFAPISYEEVAEEMKKHVFVPVDHHQSKDESQVEEM